MKNLKHLLLIFSFICIFGLNAKIYMIGDSHVSIKKFPLRVAEIINNDMPEENFEFFGIGGAGFYTFINSETNMKKIFNAKPDILLVNLGTNDSYSRVFKQEFFTKNLNKFYERVHRQLPDCQIVFITPFFNKNKKDGKWQINNNTRLCADVILDFADNHENVFVIDNNAEHGMDFIDNGLIRADWVHLTDEGYRVLADQIVESFYNIDELWEFDSDTTE